MDHGDHERTPRSITLPDFPGEQGQLRSHEGRIWKQNAITILAPFGLVITAMTGVPPRVAEIIDTDVDSIPEYIDRKMFKMRELRGAGVVTVVHVPTEFNEADMGDEQSYFPSGN